VASRPAFGGCRRYGGEPGAGTTPQEALRRSGAVVANAYVADTRSRAWRRTITPPQDLEFVAWRQQLESAHTWSVRTSTVSVRYVYFHCPTNTMSSPASVGSAPIEASSAPVPTIASSGCYLGARTMSFCTDQRSSASLQTKSRSSDGFTSEHRVGIEVGACGVEHVCRQRLVPGSGDDHVDVGGPPRIAAAGGEHRADRAVMRDRVGDGADAEERVAPVRARAEPSAQVFLRRSIVLHAVQLVRVVLPDIDLRVRERRPVEAEDATVHPRGLAHRGVEDRFAVVAGRRRVDPKGSEDRRLGRALRLRVRERVDEHREPERVGPENELLAPSIGYAAGLGERLDARAPFRLCEADLGGERVQVADEALQHRPEPLVAAAREARFDGCGQLVSAG